MRAQIVRRYLREELIPSHRQRLPFEDRAPHRPRDVGHWRIHEPLSSKSRNPVPQRPRKDRRHEAFSAKFRMLVARSLTGMLLLEFKLGAPDAHGRVGTA
jgi:hypothetical protein